MPDFLYRFPSLDKILSNDDLEEIGLNPIGKDELRKQEIYFASSDSLNDPMEGYEDIFWEGDEIVWRNLFCHYLKCLQVNCMEFILQGEESLTSNNIHIFGINEDCLTPQYQALTHSIIELFFENPLTREYPYQLSQKNRPIRRDELFFYLQTIHLFALQCIFTVFKEHQLTNYSLPENQEFNSQKTLISPGMWKIHNIAESSHSNILDFSEKMFDITQKYSNQIQTIFNYNNSLQLKRPNWKFLFLDFPTQYINELKKLLYPNWYTACFIETYNNPSMWSHYADSHKGVCLKFKTPNNSLSLTNCSQPTQKTVMQFYPINYQCKYPEIDFFRTIGVIPTPKLYEEWYGGPNNNLSSCAETLTNNEDAWRDNYWNLFYSRITTKLKDWEYEQEHRLICHNFMSDVEPCKKYSFKDLDGIIFGINTPEPVKQKIMKIIEEKCRLNDRNDFNFYQSFYSSSTGKIEKQHLNFLRFKQSKN